MAGHVGERRPIVAAAVYALVAGGWIVASDLVAGAVLDSDSLVSASLVKGAGFVAVTSVVLFFLLRARERAILAAEAVVRESTDRLRVLERAVEASPAGIAILGPPSGGMVVEYVNPAAAEISGWPREAIVGLPASEIGERLIPGDWTELLAAVAAGEPFERAYDVERPDGSTTPVAITGGAVAGPAGVVDRIVIVGTDIGAERRTETERAKLARAIDQAQEAIVITDAAAVIEYVNPAFERVSGYRRDDLVGRNPRVLRASRAARHRRGARVAPQPVPVTTRGPGDGAPRRVRRRRRPEPGDPNGPGRTSARSARQVARTSASRWAVRVRGGTGSRG